MDLASIKSQIINHSTAQARSVVQHTVSIWASQSKREFLGMIGSGFLLNINNKNYLVTALHVYQDAMKIAQKMDGEIGILRGNSGEMHYVRDLFELNEAYASDNHDAWIVELKNIYDFSMFLKYTSDTPPTTMAVPSSCSMGYPCSQNNRRANQYLENATYLQHIEDYEENSEGFLFQNYKAKDIKNITGESVDPIKLKGMSGGPLFNFYIDIQSIKENNPTAGAPPSPVGILIEYSQKSHKIKFANIKNILKDPFFE